MMQEGDEPVRSGVAMESRAGWRWHGYAGHLCVGMRCAFHLATSIREKVLVSTVGHYLPRGSDETQEIGHERKFETMVFRIDGVDADGNPQIRDHNSIDFAAYNDSREAERGHYAMCDKWA